MDDSIAPDEECSDSSDDEEPMEVFSDDDTEPEMPGLPRAEPKPRKVVGPKRIIGPKRAVGPKKAFQVQAVDEQDDNWSLDPLQQDEIPPGLENDSEWVREIKGGAT
ncbi:hypothetical protein HDE_00660 [Halotydeus destructor]|nr:hypothetical protein HDE_00660 [Halotydeus destructor]